MLCGAQVWQEVSGQIYFSALTFQIIMLGLFLIKGGTIQTILTLPLPILTISLWRSSDVLFRPPQQRLSLEAAADLDQRDEVRLLSRSIPVVGLIQGLRALMADFGSVIPLECTPNSLWAHGESILPQPVPACTPCIQIHRPTSKPVMSV